MHKLTFVYPGDLNTRTGGYRYDKRLIDGLRAEHRTQLPNKKLASWDIELISLEGDYPFPDNDQLTKAASQFAGIEDHSLVVVDGLAYSVMPEIVAAHAKRLHLVALIHHPLALETGLSDAQIQSMRIQETRALEHAQHVITTSELTADSLADYQVPAHKITAILPGTDSVPLAQGSGNQQINLLCVATLTQRKAHDVLLEALAMIKTLPWHLYCVGSTERDKHTYQSLLAKRETLALEHQVTFLGELDDDTLEQHYVKADVFVLASHHEGYGMVLSEAIAHGLPIVCTDAGAMPQTVPDGAGLLVSAGDAQALSKALATVITNNKKRSQLQSAARNARMHARSWEQAADECSALLARLARTIHA